MTDALISRFFADGDFELGRYRVLNLVREAREAFRRGDVSTSLDTVAALADALAALLDSLYALRYAHADGFAPGFAADADDDLAPTEAHAHWALALLDPLVYEGETTRLCAPENLRLDADGVRLLAEDVAA